MNQSQRHMMTSSFLAFTAGLLACWSASMGDWFLFYVALPILTVDCVALYFNYKLLE